MRVGFSVREEDELRVQRGSRRRQLYELVALPVLRAAGSRDGDGRGNGAERRGNLEQGRKLNARRVTVAAAVAASECIDVNRIEAGGDVGSLLGEAWAGAITAGGSDGDDGKGCNEAEACGCAHA
jgi:hypothetical protein